MKILYAIQATGNGHVSRAIQLLPHLSKFGKIDILLSGQNSNLDFPMPVKYRFNGISLFYNLSGGLSYRQIITRNSWHGSYKNALQLPVMDYDLIINDFEPITAYACRLRKKKSVQLSHQASFLFSETPRPESVNVFGEWILSNYSCSNQAFGFHFQPYCKKIFSPVIKREIEQADVKDKGHITVYLSGLTKDFFLNQLSKLPDVLFHCFLPEIKEVTRIKNIIFHPIDYRMFTTSMIESQGVITGGGFETPAEALYLKKKLLSIPIPYHYEQECNAAALSKMGIPTLTGKQVNHLSNHIYPWLSNPYTAPMISNCILPDMLEEVVSIAA